MRSVLEQTLHLGYFRVSCKRMLVRPLGVAHRPHQHLADGLAHAAGKIQYRLNALALWLHPNGNAEAKPYTYITAMASNGDDGWSFDKQVPRPAKSPAKTAQIRIQNRRREYLERNPSYFTGLDHELAGT